MQFLTINSFADIAPTDTRKPAVAVKKNGMARRKSKDIKVPYERKHEAIIRLRADNTDSTERQSGIYGLADAQAAQHNDAFRTTRKSTRRTINELRAHHDDAPLTLYSFHRC